MVHFICQSPACISRQRPNLKDRPYHPLEQVYEPRQVVYLDLLGPISGKGSESKSVITALDGFLRYLAVRPLKLKKSTDIAKPIHEIMATDFLYPQAQIEAQSSRSRRRRPPLRGLASWSNTSLPRSTTSTWLRGRTAAFGTSLGLSGLIIGSVVLSLP